jgi:hypothetical protein
MAVVSENCSIKRIELAIIVLSFCMIWSSYRSWRETYQNALTEQYLEYVVPLEREEVWIDRLGPKPWVN